MSRPPRAPSAPPSASRSAAVGTQLTLERLSTDGRTVGRLADGRVAFASGFVPGDVVVVTAASDKKRHVDVTSADLVRGAQDRITPACPDAVRCGGCNLLELPTLRARQLKLDTVRETLVRLGGVPRGSALLPTELIAAAPLGYRSRLRLTVDGARLGLLGAGSHQVIDIERCHVASPELWQDVEFTRQALAAAGGVPGLLQLEVRHLPGAARGSVHLLPAAREPARGAPSEALASDALMSFTRSLGERLAVHVAGSKHDAPTERLDVADDAFILSPVGGFTQVNAEVNRLLVAAVRSVAADCHATTFLDLYSGSGNFSLPLARSGLSGLAVEAHTGAVAAGKLAAAEQSLLRAPLLPEPGAAGVHFLAEDAALRAKKLAASGASFDLVVVDAPRRGADALTAHLPRLVQERLVLVSCDVATAARDLARLAASDLEIRRILAFDMFPGTHHLELFAELVPRRNGPKRAR